MTSLTWSSERWINVFDSVGGSDDDDLAAVVEAVDQGQQGRHDGRVDLVLTGGPDRGQPVDFVEEDDGGAHQLKLDSSGLR